jgi:hypothetical protein
MMGERTSGLATTWMRKMSAMERLRSARKRRELRAVEVSGPARSKNAASLHQDLAFELESSQSGTNELQRCSR